MKPFSMTVCFSPVTFSCMEEIWNRVESWILAKILVLQVRMVSLQRGIEAKVYIREQWY